MSCWRQVPGSSGSSSIRPSVARGSLTFFPPFLPRVDTTRTAKAASAPTPEGGRAARHQGAVVKLRSGVAAASKRVSPLAAG